MKRKPTKRKTAKKRAALPAKSLRDLPDMPSDCLDDTLSPAAVATLLYGPRSLGDIPLPDDLGTVAAFVAFRHAQRNDDVNRFYPWIADKYPDPADARYNAEIGSIAHAFRSGFCFALLHYADELKSVPEAVAIREALERGREKGAAASRKKAEPTHAAIRKRFRELRKTTPKKTVRYLRVAEEFGMSDRHVARIVDGID